MSHDENQIRQSIALWHRATAGGDVDAVLGLMAEDATFYVAGGAPILGRASFERNLRELLKTWRVESSGAVQEVAVSGDLAYTCTHLKVSIVHRSDAGKVSTRAGHAMSIWRRSSEGRWMLARDANMLAQVQ